MKNVILIIVLLLIPIAAVADNISFAWKYDKAQEKDIDGYRIIDGDGNIVLDAIPPTARTASVARPDKQTAYYCVAYKGEKRSDPSAIAVYTPATPPIPGPVKFLITVEPAP